MAGYWIDAQEVFGDDGLRVAVAELGPKPLPRPRPVVAALLLLGPDDALIQPLGLSELHGALVGLSDASRRIGRQCRSGGLWCVSGAHMVPCAVQFDRALAVL